MTPAPRGVRPSLSGAPPRVKHPLLASLSASRYRQLAEPGAVVGRLEIDRRTHRHNPGRIEEGVTGVVVAFDVREADRLSNTGDLVKVARIAPQVWIIDDAPEVALEVAVVNRVEAHQRGEQSPVGLGAPHAKEVARTRKPPLQPVERFEQRREDRLVCFLAAREAALVHAVIYRVIHGLVERVDFRTQRYRIEIDRRVAE